jgi:small subunit ribosomal protein S16
MAVKIRLTRTGSKKRAFFRIVAANSNSRRDGRPLEFLGWYNPHTNPAQMKVDAEKLQKWLSVGAQPTDTVRSLLNKMDAAGKA